MDDQLILLAQLNSAKRLLQTIPASICKAEVAVISLKVCVNTAFSKRSNVCEDINSELLRKRRSPYRCDHSVELNHQQCHCDHQDQLST